MSHLASFNDGGFHSSPAAAAFKKAPPLSPLAFFKEQQRTRASLQRRGDQIHFLNSKLSLELRALEQELRTDRLAQQEYLKQDARFEARKAELRKRIEAQQEFTAHFDEQVRGTAKRHNIGPLWLSDVAACSVPSSCSSAHIFVLCAHLLLVPLPLFVR